MVAVTSEALENSPDNPGTNASCTDETNNGPIQISNWQNILLVRQILMLVMNDRSHASLQVCKKPFTRKHSKTQFPFAVGESCALVSVNTANHSETPRGIPASSQSTRTSRPRRTVITIAQIGLRCVTVGRTVRRCVRVLVGNSDNVVHSKVRRG